MNQLGHHRPASTELAGLHCSRAAAKGLLALACDGLESMRSKLFDFSTESFTVSSVLAVLGGKTLLFALTTAVLSHWNTVLSSQQH